MVSKKDEYYSEEKLDLGAVWEGRNGQRREEWGLRERGASNITEACMLHGVIYLIENSQLLAKWKGFWNRKIQCSIFSSWPCVGKSHFDPLSFYNNLCSHKSFLWVMFVCLLDSFFTNDHDQVPWCVDTMKKRYNTHRKARQSLK